MSILSDEVIEKLFVEIHKGKFMHSGFNTFARAIEAAVLEAQGKQEPVAWFLECAAEDGKEIIVTPVVQPGMVKEAGAVIEAARCIRHWHDAANEGMVVSAEHVMKLWAALDEYDAMIAAAEGKK